MAFSKNYQNDVFISYAHADNTPDVSGKGWVAHFVTTLQSALKQRLGAPPDLKIFFDTRDLNSNHQLEEELLESVRNSAIFVAIASRSYASKEWPQRELEVFTNSTTELRRLFAVEYLPLDQGNIYPNPLQNHYREPFWRIDEPHSRTPLTISPTTDSELFYRRVHDIAEQIKDQLLSLNRTITSDVDVSKSTLATQPSNNNTLKRVLLAQVTDDLEEECDQVRRYLQQFDVVVMPDKTYPQGGNEFKTTFLEDLANCDIFVQLLSPLSGKAPPDIREGYTRFQIESAVNNNKEVLQWRRPHINIDSIINSDHRAILSAETVLEIGLESFKAEILRRTRFPRLEDRKPLTSRVFIDVDNDDLEIAKTLQQELGRYKIPSDLPILEGPAEDRRMDLEENLIDCDSIILIYAKSTPFWLSGQKKQFNRIASKRTADPRVLAVYIGSPSDKPDIPFHDPYPYFKVVDCRTSDDISTVVSMIAELYQ